MSDRPTKEQVKITSDLLEFWQNTLFAAASDAVDRMPSGMKSVIIGIMIVAAADIATQNGLTLDRIREAVDMGASRKRTGSAQRDKRIN